MVKIFDGPGKGKTTKLIEISARSREVILCRDENTRAGIMRSAASKKLKIPEPMTYSEFSRKGYYGVRDVKGFLIDDVDVFVQTLTRVPITGLTLCND